MQVQKNVLSPTRQMTAKTGAQIPRSPPTRGLRRSTVAPRQRDPSFPLQPLRPAAFSRPCWSRQHPPSPRVPAPCRRENSDIAPSGKTERLLWLRSQKRRANPPMNLWIQWVSGPLILLTNAQYLNAPQLLYIIQLFCVFNRTTRGCRKPMRHYVGSWRRQSVRWKY